MVVLSCLVLCLLLFFLPCLVALSCLTSWLSTCLVFLVLSLSLFLFVRSFHTYLFHPRVQIRDQTIAIMGTPGTCASVSIYNMNDCYAKCVFYSASVTSSVARTVNGVPVQSDCKCSSAEGLYTGVFHCGDSLTFAAGGGGEVKLPTLRGTDPPPQTGEGGTCASVSIYNSYDCRVKCDFYSAYVTSTVSTNNVQSDCKCSSAKGLYTGVFHCGDSLTIVAGGAGQVKLPTLASDTAACDSITITNMDNTFCDQLEKICVNLGELGQASVTMTGGTYRCRSCGTALVDIYLESATETIEAAASAEDISVSGPIFALYLGLAVMFRLICVIMSYCCLPKEEEEDSDDTKKAIWKTFYDWNTLVLKSKVKGEQKTVYDAGLIPIPGINSVMWLLKKSGVITEDTNRPLPLGYFFANTHEVSSLCFGDPKVLLNNLRWRSFLFSIVTAFAVSLVFASGNFGATVETGACQYDCMDPNSSCSTSDSSGSSTDTSGGEVEMDYKASILVAVCSSILSMGGMNAFIEALQRMRTMNARAGHDALAVANARSCGRMMSFLIEISASAIFALCFFLEQKATKDNTTATTAIKYGEFKFWLKQAAAKTGLLSLPLLFLSHNVPFPCLSINHNSVVSSSCADWVMFRLCDKRWDDTCKVVCRHVGLV